MHIHVPEIPVLSQEDQHKSCCSLDRQEPCLVLLQHREALCHARPGKFRSSSKYTTIPLKSDLLLLGSFSLFEKFTDEREKSARYALNRIWTSRFGVRSWCSDEGKVFQVLIVGLDFKKEGKIWTYAISKESPPLIVRKYLLRF